jgi:hypothetical protein
MGLACAILSASAVAVGAPPAAAPPSASAVSDPVQKNGRTVPRYPGNHANGGCICG